MVALADGGGGVGRDEGAAASGPVTGEALLKIALFFPGLETRSIVRQGAGERKSN